MDIRPRSHLLAHPPASLQPNITQEANQGDVSTANGTVYEHEHNTTGLCNAVCC